MTRIIKQKIMIPLILGFPALIQAMERGAGWRKGAISIQYTVKNDSGRTLIAEYEGGQREIKPGPAITFAVKANPIPARTIDAYIVPLRFFDEQRESSLPLLLVNVNLRAPRGPESNSWTVQAWDDTMRKIADWGALGQTKNELMAVHITVPENISQTVVDTTLSSR